LKLSSIFIVFISSRETCALASRSVYFDKIILDLKTIFARKIVTACKIVSVFKIVIARKIISDEKRINAAKKVSRKVVHKMSK
jgi:hypothetical protein